VTCVTATGPVLPHAVGSRDPPLDRRARLKTHRDTRVESSLWSDLTIVSLQDTGLIGINPGIWKRFLTSRISHARISLVASLKDLGLGTARDAGRASVFGHAVTQFCCFGTPYQTSTPPVRVYSSSMSSSREWDWESRMDVNAFRQRLALSPSPRRLNLLDFWSGAVVCAFVRESTQSTQTLHTVRCH
jgi:hypothetical protein